MKNGFGAAASSRRLIQEQKQLQPREENLKMFKMEIEMFNPTVTPATTTPPITTNTDTSRHSKLLR